jgi:membrane protein implicated in regulation of membrane protease activity
VLRPAEVRCGWDGLTIFACFYIGNSILCGLAIFSMNAGLIKSSAAVLVAGLLLTGCENMSPEANGAVFGAGAGILAGGLAAAVGASPAQAVAIGLAAGTVAGVTAYVVAKHKATERQRQYAEERARLAYERASAERRAQYRKRRYIAVDTVREKDSVGAKSVMIYDTQTEQVVGNNVYDVKHAPKQGTVSKFDTYSAEYVGTGA